MRTLTLIVVDDEAILRELVQAVFSGHTVLTADCGEKGLALLKEHPEADIVLTDKDMPDISGIEVIRQGRSIAAKPRFCMWTGNTDSQAEIAAKEAGAARFFLKPILSIARFKAELEALAA